jgi:hypothetical protein
MVKIFWLMFAQSIKAGHLVHIKIFWLMFAQSIEAGHLAHTKILLFIWLRLGRRRGNVDKHSCLPSLIFHFAKPHFLFKGNKIQHTTPF